MALLKLLLSLVILGALGCSAEGLKEEQVEVSSSCLMLAPSPELTEKTLVAAKRWTTATGCDIAVGVVGVPVVLVDRIAKGVKGRFGIDPSDNKLKLRLVKGLSDEMLQHVLDHELGHGLGVPFTHTDDGLMQAGSGIHEPITAGNLEVVCSASHCTAFRPE